MGLDMYLTGEKFYWTDWQHPENNLKGDGFDVKQKMLRLGYWKHPNLHGYIVKHFADGVDECQTINLDEDDLVQIMEAVKLDSLPDTEGFFFGKSDGSERDETLSTFQLALDWVKTKEPGVARSISYRASW